MACSGCDARRAWIARKAKLAAQALAAVLRQEQKIVERTQPHGKGTPTKPHDPAQ